MYELLALSFGAALGVTLHRLGRRIGGVVVACGAVAFGVAVSWISGELAVSWGFLVVDVGQIVVAALLVALLARALARSGAVS
jgi:hypothetical protein